MLKELLFFLISFLASIAGAICGIGGGVIIRPVLDMFGAASVATISFMSGCTVLAMSVYSVGRSLAAKEKGIDIKLSLPLSVGAVVGGVAGKELFSLIKARAESQDTVGAIQSACLAVITIATLVYVLCKSRIKTHSVTNTLACVLIGLVLGLFSSFLGIGGGPINLVVLSFFFSMETKKAAKNSLFIILFSQLASLVSTLLTNSVPEFEPLVLCLMIAGGILGGAAGRLLNKKMSEKAVDKLFVALIALIIAICVFNTLRYSAVI